MMFKFASLLLVLSSVLCAGAGTWLDLVPAESPEHPQGISLREQSTRPGLFFVGYRSHQGGGIHGGK